MTLLYAVTSNGQSVVGVGAWTAPTQSDNGTWRPGEWVHTSRPLDIYYGPTLVEDPVPYLEPRCQVFLAEGRGEFVRRHGRYAFRSTRLVRRADEMIPAWWRDTETFLDSILEMPFCTATDPGDYAVYDPDVHKGIDAALEVERKSILRRTFSLEPTGRLKTNVIFCIALNVRARLDQLGAPRMYATRIIDDATAYWSYWLANDDGEVDTYTLAKARARWLAWGAGHAVVGGTDDVVVYDRSIIALPAPNPQPQQQPLV